ncbi:DJ-1/PfpI family protein [Sinomonas sp. JGH33]|uniref:DJ-1/PfpI family protein n=1 Tax=Sinomonas terricola TaxID=3110330 RepID=A0ABU5T8R3_9MICC|nr:DJ-1/PfpI family protein [Sinomonas sp. JGH33]MEA5456078.1 DJ-1/PfpI family protein [Sinomonas sp. JGH33]
MTEDQNEPDRGTSAAPLRVVFYLPEGMADWEVGYLMSELRQREVTERPAEIVVATATGGAVTSMGGLRVTPDGPLETLTDEPFDALVLCGGASWFDDDANKAALGLAAQRKREGRLVAGICGAVDAMGGAGLLDDVDHTGNELGQLEKWPGYHGRDRFVSEPHAVRARTPAGGTIVTAGSWAPTDFAAAVMEELGALSHERSELWLRFWRDRDVSAIYGLFGVDAPTS